MGYLFLKSSRRKRLSCYLYNSAFLRQLQDLCVKITMIWQVSQFCRLKSGTKAHLYLIYNRGRGRAGPGNFHEPPAKSPQNTYTPPAWHPQNRLFHLTSETISSASLQNHPGFRQKFTKTANETAKRRTSDFCKTPNRIDMYKKSLKTLDFVVDLLYSEDTKTIKGHKTQTKRSKPNT